MNDNLQQRLIAYLDRIESTVNASTEFVASQAPDVAQQYLSWVFMSSVLCGVVFIATAIAITLVIWKLFRDRELMFIGFTVSVVATVFATFFIAEAVKVCVAPKVVIMEKVAEMIQEAK